MWNAKLDEAQAGIKIAKRIINNLRYADDSTHTAQSEEELKSLLMKVKGKSDKAVLKLNIPKTEVMAFDHITPWPISGEKMRYFILGGSKITPDGDYSHGIKRHLLLGRKAMSNINNML